VHDVLKELGFVNALDTVGGGCQQPTMDTLGIKPTLQAIDHVYCSASLAPCLRGAWVVRDPGFRQEHDSAEGCWSHSDHLPVVAEFEVEWTKLSRL
jgi:endonuclease/exonuclease/phosphatase family metal-dependent hydrolase